MPPKHVPCCSDHAAHTDSRHPHGAHSDDFMTEEQKEEMKQYQAELSVLKDELKTSRLSDTSPANRTPDKIQQFVEWARSKGIHDDNVELRPSPLGGLGLFARKSFKEDDLLLEIPLTAMLTVENALQNRRLRDFHKNHFVNRSSALIMTFYLLYQDNNPSSEWKPFLDILPKEYSSILSTTDSDMELLKGTELYHEILNIQKIFLVQFRYFKLSFASNTIANSQALFGEFTMKRFLWAYEAVWTRQNFIPLVDNHDVQHSDGCAIVPFWDMANHKQGKPVSDCSESKQSLIFYSMANVEAGDEVFNFYGDRSNFLLFTTNGFVDLETPFVGPIKLAFRNPKETEILALQRLVFNQLDIQPGKGVWLPLKTYVMPEKSPLYALKRIMIMKKPTLLYYSENDASVLLDYVPPEDLLELEQDADRWLQVRCAVLLRGIPKHSQNIDDPNIERLIRDEKLVLRSYAMDMAPNDD